MKGEGRDIIGGGGKHPTLLATYQSQMEVKGRTEGEKTRGNTSFVKKRWIV